MHMCDFLKRSVTCTTFLKGLINIKIDKESLGSSQTIRVYFLSYNLEP